MEGDQMRRVILESPYAGDVAANVVYARACLRDCLERGEAPIASHLLYTQPGVLDDGNPFERKWGIDAGLVWSEQAEAAVFYLDRGWSAGMRIAKAHHLERGITVEDRLLTGYVAPDVAITPKMVEAGLRVLRGSGVLEYENLVDESLMRRVLWIALNTRDS